MKNIKTKTTKSKPSKPLAIRKKTNRKPTKTTKVKKVGLLAAVAGLLSLCILAFYIAPNIIGQYLSVTDKSVLGVSTSGTIGNKNFEDKNFYACIIDRLNELSVNEKSNRTISHNVTNYEISQILGLDCSYKGITNLKGINILNELYHLILEGNKISSIDLSKNTNLGRLEINNNKSLTSIKMPNYSVDKLTQKLKHNLRRLRVTETSITNIDLSKLISVESVELTANKLKSVVLPIDVLPDDNRYFDDYSYLDTLMVDKNFLTSLKLTSYVNLKTLYVSSNKLTKLDLSNNEKLELVSSAGNTGLKMKTFKSPYSLNSTYTSLAVNTKNISTILRNIDTSLDNISPNVLFAERFVLRGMKKLWSGTLAAGDYLIIKDVAGTHKFALNYHQNISGPSE